jgi:hypothetical protein
MMQRPDKGIVVLESRDKEMACLSASQTVPTGTDVGTVGVEPVVALGGPAAQRAGGLG